MSKADGGLRRLIQTKLISPPDWRATPVETGGTVDGVPDLYWAHKPTRQSGWIECKKTDGWSVEMRPHQISWLAWHANHGVRCSVAIWAKGVGSTKGLGDALWLVKGSGADNLALQGLRLSSTHVLGVWYGPPKTWDWTAIKVGLLS